MSLIVKSEDEYEDLLALWSDLEAGLAVILSHPASAQEFAARVRQYDNWMQNLIQRDTDVGLYLLFQLATNSPVGYSASHALVCAVLCHLIANDFKLDKTERDSLVHAALTMNIAMTALQDLLANQRERPSPEQQHSIRSHASLGAAMLVEMGIGNPLWLQTIERHHDTAPPLQDLHSLQPVQRLSHILHVVDRYAAMISPRQSREGRSAAESAKDITQGKSAHDNPIGQALVRTVGLCPPGTFVQLNNQGIAVVVRRSYAPNLPDVAQIVTPDGQKIRMPVLHATHTGQVSIKSALTPAAVQERISHHLILQLRST
jgi:HD-GYP domain-containing protein (c-di-GMP phosphodiesterase class II)